MKRKNVSPFQKKKLVRLHDLLLLGIALLLLLILALLVSLSIHRQNGNGYAASGQVCQGMFIPADFGPGIDMDKVIAAGRAVAVMRVNNGNGPGNSADPALVSAIVRARAAGMRIMGYVDTSFGRRDPVAVKADIDKWKQFFNVTDIMFDNAYEQDTSKLAYYEDLSAYVHRQPGAIDKMNAGDIIPEAYLQAADIIGIFEGPYSKFVNFQVPAWVHNYPSTRFSAEVHSVPSASAIPTAMSLFQQNNMGYVMLTDSTNPWVGFSSDAFWTAFVAALQTGCSHTGAPSSSGITPSSFPVPSFVCGGSTNGICATVAPSPILPLTPGLSMQPPLSTIPVPTITPSSPSLNPSDAGAAPAHPSTPGTGSAPMPSLLSALLSFLLSALTLLLSLLKKL